MEVYITAACLFVGLYIIWRLMRKTANLPPGPKGLPLLGNIHQLDKTGAHKTCIQWSKTYGDIFTINLFGDNVIVVQGEYLIQEVLVKKSMEFAGRQEPKRCQFMTDEVRGIGMFDFDEKWVQRKKLLMKGVKGYGEGLSKLEEVSHVYIRKMVERIESETRGGGSICMKPLLHHCTGGIITSILYGEQLKEDDLSAVLATDRPLMEMYGFSSPAFIFEFFPSLQHLPLTFIKDIYKGPRAYLQWLKDKEEEMKIKADLDHPRSMFDEVLRQQTKTRMTEAEFRGIISDTLVPGFATTTTTLYGLMSVLVNKLEIQKKIQDEIKSVIGEREPRLSDRVKMPYTEAVILEILRYTTILPFLVPHKATVDTTLAGYEVPKGTLVMPNVWGLHHDERYWQQPFEFDPHRFLTSEGELVAPDHVNRKRLFPFSAGRRVCAGESLARNRMYLIVSSLLQKFTFLPENSDHPPVYDPRSYTEGLIMQPIDFNVNIQHVNH